MGRKCKICGLPDNVRRAIERDMKMGQIGVTRIVKKYPQAQLTEGNIYSHKGHLILSEARDVYDKSLQEKVDDVEREKEAICEIDILESPDKMKIDNHALIQTDDKVVNTLSEIPPKQSLTKQMATNLIESGTTGNRIMDDVLMLDTFIQQGANILEQVTPGNVMEAIRLKHALLDGRSTASEVEKKIEINMAVLLKQIAKEQPEITIVTEASVEDEE